ncbi:MAG: GDP-mannose-dependent alpha-mannosyltransferase [Candidatus Dichloromethanomonas elyunquensis]|nr:MAG: GDP-mannose-dependent alpha-mannosyltransferase [Candidatus Dichloromethanomonas elyunquensis]
MRIAIVSDTFYPQVNGVCNTFGKMVEYMDKKGTDYRFYVPLWEPRVTANDSDRIFRFDSIKPWFYPECRLAVPNRRNYIKLKNYLDRFQPQILHIATEFSLGYLALKYARESGIPTIMSYHTDIPSYLKYYSFQFVENAVWAYFRWFHSYAQLNLVPSQSTMAQLQVQEFSNLSFWKRGIDLERFSPSHKQEEIHNQIALPGEILLLYVGRISAEKELDVLIEAVRILRDKGLPFKLAMVGDGPYRQELESRREPNVVFLGYRNGKELQNIYASADVFVFPSSSETYGNVILEAMASGLPVVAPFSGGIRENLVDGYNGLAFTIANSPDMAVQIERMITEHDTRKRLGENAVKSVANKTWESVFEELFQLYGSFLRDNHKIQKLTA